ncbi:hypothetical protein [Novosphingobium sp.]|uniref:hypothetical protein n=1 Tax=Novosphingobium sp. TaxID=1874826 RepID=UPI003D1366F7
MTYTAATSTAAVTPEPIAPATAVPAQGPADFATLVDAIARARDDYALASAAPVGVTMQHADFGPVSMQFTARDQGLAVTMRSADPGFAPAAAAAAAATSSSAGTNNSQSDTGHNHANTPDPSPTTAPAQTAGTPHANTHAEQSARHNSSLADNQSGQQSGQQPRNQPRTQPAQANPAAAAQSGDDATDNSAIFA